MGRRERSRPALTAERPLAPGPPAGSAQLDLAEIAQMGFGLNEGGRAEARPPFVRLVATWHARPFDLGSGVEQLCLRNVASRRTIVLHGGALVGGAGAGDG